LAPPLLVVVSGPPGSGTTTLAHTLARAIPCPAICRDEIKEGLVHAEPDYRPGRGDAMAHRTLDAFFGVLSYLVDAGVSLVAEASFQHRVWEPGLGPLLDKARIRIVHCRVEAAVARERMARRVAETPARRAVHGDPSVDEPFERFEAAFESFESIGLPVPSMEVDTTNGYEPTVDEIVGFVTRA
jgi:predicted kinase